MMLVWCYTDSDSSMDGHTVIYAAFHHAGVLWCDDVDSEKLA